MIVLNKANQTNTKTLIFIDRALDNYEQLSTGAVAEAEVVILDPKRDGIEQITEVLHQNPQLKAIHILCHGSPGCLYLGNTHLGLDNLDDYASLLQTWTRTHTPFGRKSCGGAVSAVARQTLYAPSPTFLLYGCNVAAGEAGEAFITRLHHLTGANIAASATLTGNAAVGGNWELEVKTSEREIPLAIAPEVREAYAGVLATLTVTTLDDENNGTGAVSLREAIAQANTTQGADTIVFASSLSGTITLSLGQLAISDALTIDGLGANVLTVSGNNASRVFYVQNAGAVNIEGLTITQGSADNGGGVKNIGSTLTLSDSALARNRATANGGGVYSQGSTATTTISNSTLFGNTASNGGGLYNLSGTASLSNSTISGNTASNGGGIYNKGTASLSNSTFSDNTAKSGGGFYNKGTASLSNSTISGNTASNGGGIFNYKGTASVSNSTISGNSANFDGGGILNAYGTANVTSTIIAANSANKDIGGPTAFTSKGNNLIGNGDGAGGFSNGVKNDIVGTTANPINPQLGPLANNGGPTQTQALQPGSPAINKGSNPNTLTTDQRFLPRTSGGAIDIGAYELETSLTVDTLVDENDGNFGPGDLSLREAIAFIAAGGTINFAESLKGGTITLGLGQLLINQALTINGLGASNLTVSGNNASRIFYIQNAGTVSISGLTITGGSADNGGGVRNLNSNLTLSNSAISGNKASNYGGGVYSQGKTATTTISNSAIAGNKASAIGGGISNRDGTANISNSTLSGNTASFGGGIYNGGIGNGGTANISNSIISGNSASSGFGGGIYNKGLYNNSTANISNSTISGNSASGSGSGIDNKGTANISNSTLSGNTAGFRGGGINNGGAANISNSTISGNTADNDGGGIYNYSTANISNSTISGNTADNDGGGIYNRGTANVTSTIIAANIDNKDIAGNSTFGSGGNNLIGNGDGIGGFSNGVKNDIVGTAAAPINPRLGPLANNGGPTQTQALLPGSPAINTGSNPNNLTTDQRGAPRAFGEAIDIGAYELFTSLTVDTLVDENDGDFSPGDLSLREAIALFADFTTGGGTVNFAESLSGRTITLSLGQLLIDQSLTINGLGASNLAVSGNNASRVFYIQNAGTVNISGLTITGGSANTGGGVKNINSTLTLSNSAIAGNKASATGGGVYSQGSTAATTISNSTLSGNTAQFGGGIFNIDGTASISNSTLSGNTASSGSGGGIFNIDGTASISNSTLSGNTASSGSGGGIYNGGTANVTSTIIAANINNKDIGGASAFTSKGNNLIGNKGDAEGFINNVNDDIVGTAANPINPQLGLLANNGGPTQTQALNPGSPALNKGSNPNNLTTDQRGTGFNREVGGQIDIGAFEVQNPSPTAANPHQAGTNGPDILTGDSGPDTLKGRGGNDTLTGGADNDILHGGKGDDLLHGGAGADTIKGGRGADSFSYPLLSDSLLSGFDQISGLAIGTDILDGPEAVSAAALKELGAVASLTQAGISGVLSASSFGANGAATFTFGSRQFVALNDGVAGFSETTDAIIEITGFKGNLTALAIV